MNKLMSTTLHLAPLTALLLAPPMTLHAANAPAGKPNIILILASGTWAMPSTIPRRTVSTLMRRTACGWITADSAEFWRTMPEEGKHPARSSLPITVALEQ
jgi:hypothetical protein